MTGHLFDLARLLTGSESISVAAFCEVFGKGKERLRTVSDLGIDTVEIQMRFNGGHCLSIGLNWGLPENTPGYCQELIHGPPGMMYSEDSACPDRFLGDLSQSVRVAVKDSQGVVYLDFEPDENDPHACTDELVASIRSGVSSQFDGYQGRAALQLIPASLRAIETGEIEEIRQQGSTALQACSHWPQVLTNPLLRRFF